MAGAWRERASGPSDTAFHINILELYLIYAFKGKNRKIFCILNIACLHLRPLPQAVGVTPSVPQVIALPSSESG
jgi:hypothetical protein